MTMRCKSKHANDEDVCKDLNVFCAVGHVCTCLFTRNSLKFDMPIVGLSQLRLNVSLGFTEDLFHRGKKAGGEAPSAGKTGSSFTAKHDSFVVLTCIQE